MAHGNTYFALSEAEIDMVKHIVDIRVLEDLTLSECSIYKVPCNLRKVNEEAYTPHFISIGPIHLDKEELKAMQEHKIRYFHFFWERVSSEHAMRFYKKYLEREEEKIRQCYAEKFPGISKEKFIDMMLLDTVFIMELFLRNRSWKPDTSKHEHDYVQTKSFRLKHSDDSILTMPWLSKNITRDLILLENQIPFFVLKELYESVVPHQEHDCFVDLALEYFAFYGSLCGGNSKKPSHKSMNKDSCKSSKHFTDLIRYFYLPTDLPKSDCSDYVLRTATKLRDAGVCFEKDDKSRLLDITFEKTPFLSYFVCLGCLPCMKHFKTRFRIPQLKVDHTTECVLRNLIALEQCHYPEQPYICNYVSLIDSLIHTQLDVELLVEKEVIVHELGSHKEVATLINGLCKHVVANTTYYYDTIDKIKKHYKNVWNRTMAKLWLVYFRDPWRASSTAVGIAVLVFAVFNFLRVVRYLI